MATSSKQDKDFMDALLPSNLLEDAIEWIGKHMNPEEVFDERELRAWAIENGFTDE